MYLLFTLPCFFLPYIYYMYILSALYAAVSGLIALGIFFIAFYLLQRATLQYLLISAILFLAIPLAVGAAYKALIVVIMPVRGFWKMDGFTLFPIAAILSGWVSILISLPRIKEHFTLSIINEIETISVQP